MAQLPNAQELALYTLAAQHPITRTWVPDAERVQRLAENHELDVLLAVDTDIAARRAARFAPHLPPKALLNRWVEVSDDLDAMMSIRFEGEDAKKPFVDSTPLSRAVTHADLPALANVAQKSFARLRPLYIRLWSAESAGYFEECNPDKRFMAGKVEALVQGFMPVPSALVLRPVSSVVNYEHARHAYAAMRNLHPEHAGQASLQSEDDLRESAEAGLLFEVLVDGRWAGYVSATCNSDSLGLPGYVVQELILAPEHRGRGYGRYLTTLLARALPNSEAVLVGTIHADNKGAMQSALSAGRVDVGGWFQVAIPWT
jgi:L-amino acid N-acyltransferase YncA